jgi:DNA polymerase-3 subunit alpha
VNAPDLHCHSTYSILDGFGTPKEIVKRAKELKWDSVAITEHGHLMSAVDFYKAARAEKINPIIGCEFYVVPDDILGVKTKDARLGSYHLTVLALSMEGYQNLVAWTTFAHQRENFYYKPRISLDKMFETAKWGLHHNVILSGCLGSELCSVVNEDGYAAALAYVHAMEWLFPHFYIEIQDHHRDKFIGHGFQAYEDMLVREELAREKLIALSEVTGVPLVLTNDSHMQRHDQRKAHLAMKASAWKNRDDDHNARSAERLSASYIKDYVYFNSYMQSMEKIADDIPKGNEALGSIRGIVGEARIELDPLDRFRLSLPFSGYDDTERAIRNRSKRRLARLTKKHGVRARERFEHEFESLGGFAHYLLLMSDFIIAAKDQGILTNSRGSAANSLLCYCLGIHDVDSLEYELTFERFHNPERQKVPDIDIDIEKDRYEDFIQIVKERMVVLEGDGQVVQICNLGTHANRSAFRLVAEALGIPKEQQDEVAKLLPQMIDSGMVEEENDVYEALKADFPEIYELASGVFDSIRNVSQHACGWLFGTKERPIEDWVPLILIASSNSMVTQFNMKALEDLGLVKGDFLRLRTLSVVKRCLTLLGKSALDISNIPLDDPATFEMLRAGRTEGIFTLQGKENRRGVVDVEVQGVHDVIASVAIYRPALTRPGYDKVYNDRRLGKKTVSYPSPISKSILGSTYGLPIFQEQIMEIGYALGMGHLEVEEFLRAIKVAKGVGRGAKEAFAKLRPMFMKYARKTLSKEEAEGEWKFVTSFQGYGFNKGHATSYGLLAVRAAYLKANHPSEFFTALLDVYPEKSKYIAAARAEGYAFAAPSVNDSAAGFSLTKADNEIRVGLERIKGLGPVAVREIVAGQPYSSLDDLHERTTRRAVNVKRVEVLAALGALDCLGVKKTGGDLEEFDLLGFTLKKPKALKNFRPAFVAERTSERGWHHAGLEKGVEFTPPGKSVSKRFWLPPSQFKPYEKKASAWAQVHTHLLVAVDENGVGFHIMANEDKKGDVKSLQALYKLSKEYGGLSVCLDGAVRQSFLTDGPLGFRFYGITGAYTGKPQFHTQIDKKYVKGISTLEQQRRRMNAS